MKFYNVQRIWQSPFYVNFKKHFCPDCGELLRKAKESRVLHPGSDMLAELERYSVTEMNTIGKTKYIWTEFLCPKCGRQFTVDTMKKIEDKNGK